MLTDPEAQKWREKFWVEEAGDILTALYEYEENHPDGVICLIETLEAAERALVNGVPVQ